MACELYRGAVECTGSCTSCKYMTPDGWKLVPDNKQLVCDQTCRRRKLLDIGDATEPHDCSNCKFNKGV